MEVRHSMKITKDNAADETSEADMVDKDLLRNCVEIFVSMGMGSLDAYTQDFEEALCQGTTVSSFLLYLTSK